MTHSRKALAALSLQALDMGPGWGEFFLLNWIGGTPLKNRRPWPENLISARLSASGPEADIGLEFKRACDLLRELYEVTSVPLRKDTFPTLPCEKIQDLTVSACRAAGQRALPRIVTPISCKRRLLVAGASPNPKGTAPYTNPTHQFFPQLLKRAV